MPNYYIDTEFHEGFHKPLFGRRRHFIDLISIAIVDEYDRTYYAISKDFDVKAAWNAWQPGEGQLTNFGMEKRYPKVYWLRENVLRPIFNQLWYEKCHLQHLHHCTNDFTLSNVKRLVSLYGKSNSAIASDIVSFTMLGPHFPMEPRSDQAMAFRLTHTYKKLSEAKVFYGYYADYDWVLLCSLFGKMIDLPSGFPMYMRDLKQMLDELCELIYPGKTYWHKAHKPDDLNDRLAWVKARPDYPKQVNEHSALDDARWNKELHLYLQNLWVTGGR